MSARVCQGGKETELINDKDVIAALGSASSDVASKAVAEVMRRGERMIPLLIGLRGCRNTFFGAGLGNPMSSQVIPAAPANGLQPIPLEQAALYLINAIYEQQLGFAESPYLVDLLISPAQRKPLTSKSMNRRAWRAVLDWNQRYKTVGVEDARKKGDAPLRAAALAFW